MNYHVAFPKRFRSSSYAELCCRERRNMSTSGCRFGGNGLGNLHSTRVCMCIGISASWIHGAPSMSTYPYACMDVDIGLPVNGFWYLPYSIYLISNVISILFPWWACHTALRALSRQPAVPNNLISRTNHCSYKALVCSGGPWSDWDGTICHLPSEYRLLMLRFCSLVE